MAMLVISWINCIAGVLSLLFSMPLIPMFASTPEEMPFYYIAWLILSAFSICNMKLLVDHYKFIKNKD